MRRRKMIPFSPEPSFLTYSIEDLEHDDTELQVGETISHVGAGADFPTELMLMITADSA